MAVVKWQFDEEYIEVNPTSFLRPFNSGATYVDLTDGTQVRINPENRPKEDVTIVWDNIGQSQLDLIKSKMGKKVEVITHLQETIYLFFDELNEENLLSGGGTPRYMVTLKAREA